MNAEEVDPIGLIRESYRMEGIGPSECRSIFLDWALRLPTDADQGDAIGVLLDQYGEAVDHPMTAILKEASGKPVRTGRRGGHRSRTRP